MTRPPRLLTIPASAPFLATLADALLDGGVVEGFAPRGDPLALASATIFLPTRRAGRLFAEALRERCGGTVLLPRIVPVGDVDEDALAFAEGSAEPPKSVHPTTRRLALARLVGAWRTVLEAAGEGRAAVAAGPGAGLALADALAELIDEMAARQVPWSRLDVLVPGEHDRYWDMALDFLKIAREAWPAFLADAGLVDPSVRRDRLIEAEAARLASLGEAAGPVIAAGSTGSMPATATLLAAVARLPLGAVVLPGLDTALDAPAWRLLTGEHDPAPSHPQYGLARLLERIGATRDDVLTLAAPAAHGRERLLSEALRPAAATDAWAALGRPEAGWPDEVAAAFAAITVIEADEPREEALAIALVLREALEAPDRTAALVTPDRDLARRVAAELLRFGIAIDDSAGEPLSESLPGRLARIIADVAAEGLAPVPLAGLLRHPHVRLEMEPDALAHAADLLELMVLRGPRPAAGAEGLKQAVAAFRPEDFHRSDPRRKLGEDERADAADLAARIGEALGPLLELAAGRHPFVALVEAHREAGAAVLAGFAAPADDIAYPELTKAFDALTEGAPLAPEMTLADYAAALPDLLSTVPVRPAFNPSARLRILGPLEARLVAVDRMVLGGLVEDVWPSAVRTDPWLSRPMRAGLGLEAPERRIGLSAHDFAQFCGAPELVLTRAAKIGGAPTVPSRFLQRLAAVAGTEAFALAQARGARWRRLARLADEDKPAARLTQPAPTPALALRPTQLSVTEIETFLRDPYAIYARHILKLRRLDPLDAAPGAAERGSAIHEALGEFAKAHPESLPIDAAAALEAFGRAAFAPLEAFPAEHALWWARFIRLVPAFIAWERARRPGIERVVAEAGGRMGLPGTRGPFTLTGYADRIELRRDGLLSILDFKTGSVPTAKQASANYSPQLPLEAAMAARGGFDRVPAAEAAELTYIRLRSGTPPLQPRSAVEKDTTAPDLAAATLTRLETLVKAFENEAQGYVALRRPMFRSEAGDYGHLARVGEWSLSEGGEE